MSDKRRMFSATVIGSAEFMLMQPLSQVLYMQLCMSADDAGVLNNARMIARMAGAKEKHLEELCSAGFLIRLDINLHVVRHWFVSNQIRSDKIKVSDYSTKLDECVFVNEKTSEYCLKTGDKVDETGDKVDETGDKVDETGDKVDETGDKVDEKKENGDLTRRNFSLRRLKSPLPSIGEYSIEEDSIVKESIGEDSIAKERGKNADDNNFDAKSTQDTTLASKNTHTDTQNTQKSLPIADFSNPDDKNAMVFASELEKKAEKVRLAFQSAGVKVPNANSWWMREFKFALESKRALQLSDADFFGALENYTTLLEKARASPNIFWWDRKLPIGSLFRANANGKSPPILRFLPDVFSLDEFKCDVKQQEVRGIDSAGSKYDMKALADKQAAARTDRNLQEAIDF